MTKAIGTRRLRHDGQVDHGHQVPRTGKRKSSFRQRPIVAYAPGDKSVAQAGWPRSASLGQTTTGSMDHLTTHPPTHARAPLPPKRRTGRAVTPPRVKRASCACVSSGGAEFAAPPRRGAGACASGVVQVDWVACQQVRKAWPARRGEAGFAAARTPKPNSRPHTEKTHHKTTQPHPHQQHPPNPTPPPQPRATALARTILIRAGVLDDVRRATTQEPSDPAREILGDKAPASSDSEIVEPSSRTTVRQDNTQPTPPNPTQTPPTPSLGFLLPALRSKAIPL